MDKHQQINVLIVNQDMIHRQYFDLLLKDSQRYHIVNALEPVELDEQYCTSNSVHLILIETYVSKTINTFTTVRKLKRNLPDIKVIMMTKYPELSFLSRAKGAGADGFLYTNTSNHDFIELLDAVTEGKQVFPELMPVVKIGNAYSHEFTAQELRVLKEIVSGAADAEVAENLYISINTVKYHIKNIKQKTGLKNRTQLAVQAVLSGLVIPEV